MSFQEFLERYNGEFVEEAGSPDAKNQCVDLANRYIREVLGLPIIEWTNAVDFPSKADPAKYTWIPNGDSNYPLEGDLIVWKGTYGHIAIALNGCTSMKLICFEENNPLGTNAHVGTHNYTNVKGWLHPTQIVNSESLDQCNAKLAEETKKKQDNWNWGMEMQTELEGAKAQILTHENNLKAIAGTLKTETEMPKILGEITKMLSYEDQNRQLTAKNQELANQATIAQQKQAELEKSVDDLSIINKAQADQLSEQEKTLNSLQEQVAENKQKHDIKFQIGNVTLCVVGGGE